MFVIVGIVVTTVFVAALPPAAATAEAVVTPPAHSVNLNAGVASDAALRVRVENHWREVSRGVYDVGDATWVDPVSGERVPVRGVVHMLYVDGYFSNDASPNGSSIPATESCSEPLLAGLQWDTTFEWIIDPTNSNGISRNLIVNALWHSTNEIERRLIGSVITGQDTDGCADGIDTDSPDGKNEIMFVPIEEAGVLAFMVGWVSAGKLVNTDIAFNTHFTWGNASTDANVHDVENIGTHEIGHAYGMAHITVSLATMQATAAEGETHKRDLLPCEQVGLCDMYDQNPATSCESFNKAALTAFIDVGSGSRCEGTTIPSAASMSYSIAVVSATFWLLSLA